MDECRYLLESLKNQNVVLRFVKRLTNKVARYLARYSCSLAERKWDGGMSTLLFIICFVKIFKSNISLLSVAKKKCPPVPCLTREY